MDISIDEIRKLPTDEQLNLAEQIWEGLAQSGALLRQWQIDEGNRRSAEIEADPSIALTHQEMWDRVDQLRNDN